MSHGSHSCADVLKADEDMGSLLAWNDQLWLASLGQQAQALVF